MTSVLEHCHEGDTNCWFSIFWFCIPKAMKNVSVHIFIYSSNSCKLYQRILGTF
jgi:hypothetical protein